MLVLLSEVTDRDVRADVQVEQAEVRQRRSGRIKGRLHPDRHVAPNGGAVALGHPIGASGARVLVTLIYEMIRRDVKRGIAVLCLGGGNAVAMAVER